MRTIRRDPPQFMWVLIIYKRLFSIIIEFHLLSFTNTTDGFSLALWDPGSCMGPISFMGPTSCWHQDASSGWQGSKEVGVAKQAMFFHAFPYLSFLILPLPFYNHVKRETLSYKHYHLHVILHFFLLPSILISTASKIQSNDLSLIFPLVFLVLMCGVQIQYKSTGWINEWIFLTTKT